MKSFIFNAAIFLLSILPFAVQANKWNDPDMDLFKYQKNVDNTVSSYAQSMSTIYFHGKLFNFMNYSSVYVSDGYKIVIRKLTLSDDRKHWTMTKQENIVHLQGLSYYSFWQPTPVIFHDSLYLFVENGSNGEASYSMYDEPSDSWSSPTSIPNIYPNHNAYQKLNFGSAVVVGDKLCLICSDFYTTTRIYIFWTRDMVNWHYYDTGIECGLDYGETIGELIIHGLKTLGTLHISAISKSWIDNSGNFNTKLMLAYLTDNGLSAKIAEFAFDNQDNIQLLSNVTVANEFEYAYVSLVDGTVNGDPTSNSTTQLFLKKREKDNWYLRYRILRYQKVEGGSWSKRENNLVPQNYLWADKRLDLNAVNYQYTEIVSGIPVIKKLMCLVYRGYDDWDHPLNIAWAENTQTNLANPRSTFPDASPSDDGIENNLVVQNWPNPFSANTMIKYHVGDENTESNFRLQQHTTLSIYDIHGNMVKMLVNEIMSQGTYEIQWDASSFPEGLYFCRLRFGNSSAVCKFIICN